MHISKAYANKNTAPQLRLTTASAEAMVQSSKKPDSLGTEARSASKATETEKSSEILKSKTNNRSIINNKSSTAAEATAKVATVELGDGGGRSASPWVLFEKGGVWNKMEKMRKTFTKNKNRDVGRIRTWTKLNASQSLLRQQDCL